MIWLVLSVVVVMLAAAVAVLVLDNMIAAVVAISVVSLALTLIFVILRAPDVAMTEAAIGAGLSGLILIIGLRRLGYWQIASNKKGEGDD
jgi:uncharacterized MnhB-related membrane protein